METDTTRHPLTGSPNSPSDRIVTEQRRSWHLAIGKSAVTGHYRGHASSPSAAVDAEGTPITYRLFSSGASAEAALIELRRVVDDFDRDIRGDELAGEGAR